MTITAQISKMNLNTTFTINESMIKSPTVWQNVCELNQVQMLQTLDRLPKVAFWITLLMAIFLAIQWIVIPFFANTKYYEWFKDSFLGFAFALSVFPPLILYGYVYYLTEQTINYITNGIYIFIAIYLVVYYIHWRKNHK